MKPPGGKDSGRRNTVVSKAISEVERRTAAPRRPRVGNVVTCPRLPHFTGLVGLGPAPPPVRVGRSRRYNPPMEQVDVWEWLPWWLHSDIMSPVSILITMVATGVIAAATVFNVWLARRMAKAAKDSADAAKGSADTAQAILEAAHRQSEVGLFVHLSERYSSEQMRAAIHAVWNEPAAAFVFDDVQKQNQRRIVSIFWQTIGALVKRRAIADEDTLFDLFGIGVAIWKKLEPLEISIQRTILKRDHPNKPDCEIERLASETDAHLTVGWLYEHWRNKYPDRFVDRWAVGRFSSRR